ncbi:hypothetical protein D9611_009048 [Ephemerocybe angulata]|uniref:JmjC domain-containing protein n=1 Tax=Ephemerocybe angulata TaxID=980116 RepID=A0A8H5CEP9_9AGAR|nr:hypothetical protein D9611_009048 [Tulosesus angulatus]
MPELDRESSPLFTSMAWKTDLPLLPSDDLVAALEDTDCIPLVESLRTYTTQLADKIPSLRTRKVTALSLFFPLLGTGLGDPYAALRTAERKRLGGPYIQHVSTVLMGYKTLDTVASAIHKYSEPSSVEDVERQKSWAFNSLLWHVGDLRAYRKRVVDNLTKLLDEHARHASSNADFLDAPTLAGPALSTARLTLAHARSSSLTEAWRIVSNLEMAGLHLNLLLRGILTYPSTLSVDDPATQAIFSPELLSSPEFAAFLAQCPKFPAFKGLLHGAIFIDPLYAVTTRNLAAESFCLEEAILAAKALGSARPKELERINDAIFDMVYRISQGALVGVEIARELSDLLKNGTTVSVMDVSSRYWYMPEDGFIDFSPSISHLTLFNRLPATKPRQPSKKRAPSKPKTPDAPPKKLRREKEDLPSEQGEVPAGAPLPGNARVILQISEDDDGFLQLSEEIVELAEYVDRTAVTVLASPLEVSDLQSDAVAGLEFHDQVVFTPKGDSELVSPKFHLLPQASFFEGVMKLVESHYISTISGDRLPLHLASPKDSIFDIVYAEGSRDIETRVQAGVPNSRKCIVVVDTPSPSVPFTAEGLFTLAPLNTVIPVQNQTIADKKGDYKSWMQSGCLQDLLDSVNAPPAQQIPLNALDLPDYVPPPGVSPFSLDQRIWARTNYGTYVCKGPFPTGDMNWFLAATAYACHAWHIDSDGLGTFLDVLYGDKWWVVAYDPDRVANDDVALTADPNLDPWKPGIGQGKLKVEALLLTHGTRLMMPPGMMHSVFTLKPAICRGGHYYTWANMDRTLYARVHSLLRGPLLLNTSHSVTWEMLCRFMAFLHSEVVVTGWDFENRNDLPVLSTKEDFIRLACFFCMIELANVLSPETYACSSVTFPGISSSKAFTACDINAVPDATRRSFAYSRGLLTQTLKVLSLQIPFRSGNFTSTIYQPTLAWTALQIRLAFDALNPPPGSKEIIKDHPFGQPYARDMFRQQLSWVVEANPDVQAAYDTFAMKCQEPTSLRWDDWVLSRVVDLPPPKSYPKYSDSKYLGRGMRRGDQLYFETLRKYGL